VNNADQVIERQMPIKKVRKKLHGEHGYKVERQTVPATHVVTSRFSHAVDQVAVFVVIAHVKVDNNLYRIKLTFHARCCHKGTALKHLAVPDRVKPYVIRNF